MATGLVPGLRRMVRSRPVMMRWSAGAVWLFTLGLAVFPDLVSCPVWVWWALRLVGAVLAGLAISVFLATFRLWGQASRAR